MENAQLISLSRQIALRRQMDVVANNIANLNTTGFKSEALLFEEYIPELARDRSFAFADQPLSFTDDWATVHDMTGGALVATGNELDVALSGEGFLVVDTPAGERWTRAGALQINAEGTLVDLSGNPVQGTGGPLQFTADETGIVIGPDGTVSTSLGLKGQLRLVEFDDPQALERVGDNLFSGGAPRDAEATAIIQGSLEKSNVSAIGEMARMIEVQRAYQSLSSLMQRQDEVRRTAVQKLGSLQA